jgi:uncharacterized membrane protein
MVVLDLTFIQLGQLQHLLGLEGITQAVAAAAFTTAVMLVLVVLGVEEVPTSVQRGPMEQ